MPKKWDFVTNANVNPLTGQKRTDAELAPFAVNPDTGKQDYLTAHPDFSWFQFDPQGSFNTTAKDTQERNANRDQFGLPVPPLGTTTIRPTAVPMGVGAVVNNPANAAGRGEDVGNYIQSWQQGWNLPPTSSSIDVMLQSLRTEGWDAKRADHNGQPSDDKIDLGNGWSVDLIQNVGQPNAAWSYQLYPTDGSGGSGNGGGGGTFDTGAGGGGMDVSATLDKAIADLVARGGQTGMGQEVGQVLMDIIRGGHAPELSKQLVGAREAEAGAMRSQVNDARGMLADRGLLSEPGVPQGAEENMVERLTQNLALPYSQAVGDIESSTLNNALTLATGMSNDQAQNILSAVGTGTNRTVALASIALQALASDRDWQKFLSQFGLTQTQVMEQLRQGRVDQVIRLAELFGKDAALASGGYI